MSRCLNGAEGLNGTVAALASQGMAILHAVTDGFGNGSSYAADDDDARPPAGPPRLGQGDGGQPG